MENLNNFKNNLNNNSIEVSTIGVHTCRYNIFEIIDDDIIIYPCGVYLQKFSLIQNRILKKLKFSNSVVSSICRNLNYLIAACYNGNVCVIDIEKFEIVSEFKLENVSEVSHVSVSNDMRFIAISCDYFVDEGKILDGALFIYKINNCIENEDNISYSHLNFIKLKESLCEFNQNNNLIVLEKKLIEGTIPKSSNYYYTIIEYNLDNKFELIPSREKIIEHYDEISNFKKYKNILIIHFIKRMMRIFDLINFTELIIINFEGAGCIGSFDYIDNNLYVTNISRNLIKINLEEYLNKKKVQFFSIPKNNKNNKNDKDQLPVDKSIKLVIQNDEHIKQLNYVIRINKNQTKIFWANEHGLFCYDLELNKYILILLSIIKSSGCGVTINKNNNLIAVGDLERNITVLNINSDENNLVIKSEELIFSHFEAEEPIRTLHWDEILDTIYVGTMGGKLYQTNKDFLELDLVDDLKQTITCIRVSHLSTGEYAILTVSTTGGDLHNYKINKNNLINDSFNLNLDEVLISNSFKAHLPQLDNLDDRFGSLKFKSEIWSIATHPTTLLNQHLPPNDHSLYLITSSEDQTTKIWQYSLPITQSSPTLLLTHKHHNLAVTSVDWKPMRVCNGEVLATCSDDKTIQIYNPIDNFNLVKTLNTDMVLDWHTITYLALEEDGIHLAVSTQNGFVVIFNLEDFNCVFCEKLHLGGIEGLCWKGKLLVTCGSDLNIGIIKFL